MKLLLENLPASLQPERETLRRCLEAMDGALPLREVWLFGSHARGEARPDSDVDFCLVTEGATSQRDASIKYREAIWEIWPRPSMDLIPITPERLEEKKACGDFFYGTILKEGVRLAAED